MTETRNWEICPHCGGTQIEGLMPTLDGMTVTRRVMCTECLAEWTEEYTAGGRTNKHGGHVPEVLSPKAAAQARRGTAAKIRKEIEQTQTGGPKYNITVHTATGAALAYNWTIYPVTRRELLEAMLGWNPIAFGQNQVYEYFMELEETNDAGVPFIATVYMSMEEVAA